MSALVESKIGNITLNNKNFSVVRHPQCMVLHISPNVTKMCTLCASLRKKLKAYERGESGSTSVSRISDTSPVNLRFLSNDELRRRLENTQIAKKEAVRNALRLSTTVKELTELEGVSISDDLHGTMTDVLQKTDKSPFEEDTPQWLLWEQQKQQAQKKDSRGMRWHPLIIRWCLSIYHTSPAAYRQLSSKKNKFIMLPHVNTLKKFTNFTEPSSGFNADIIQRLAEECKEYKPFMRNVVIVFDEMKVKADLVYSRSTGKIIGFTDMGNVNDELQLFADRCSGIAASQKEFSKYVNVFMVRGIFSNLTYPFGYYGSTGMTGSQLFPCALEATRVLEAIGLKVRAWICDGCSSNRKFFSICKGDDEGFWTRNPFDNSRKIYFISDVPHLMKTTRNNFENSHGNTNSRNLHVSVYISCFHSN